MGSHKSSKTNRTQNQVSKSAPSSKTRKLESLKGSSNENGQRVVNPLANLSNQNEVPESTPSPSLETRNPSPPNLKLGSEFIKGSFKKDGQKVMGVRKPLTSDRQVSKRRRSSSSEKYKVARKARFPRSQVSLRRQVLEKALKAKLAMKYIDSSSSPITSPTSPTFSSSLSSTLTSPNPFDGDMGITRATQAVVAPSATPSSHTDCRLEITSLGNQALDVRSTDANGPPSLDDENTPGELMGDLQARVVQDQLQSAVDTPSPGEVTSSGEHTDVLVPRLDSDTVEKDANSINVPITERVDTLDTHLDTVIQDVNSVIEPISERIDTLVAPVDTVSQDVNNVNTSITEGLDTIVQEVKNISLRASDRPMSLTQAVTNHGNRIDVLSTHLQTIEEHVGGAERRVGNVTTDNCEQKSPQNQGALNVPVVQETSEPSRDVALKLYRADNAMQIILHTLVVFMVGLICAMFFV